jgi:IS5 family transposase
LCLFLDIAVLLKGSKAILQVGPLHRGRTSDKGYASGEKKAAAEEAGVLWAVKEKAKPGRELTKRQRARNRRFGKVRAKVEHVFRVLKCQFGYRKVRYRGIAKNAAQVFALLALANLYLVRSRLASA